LNPETHDAKVLPNSLLPQFDCRLPAWCFAGFMLLVAHGGLCAAADDAPAPAASRLLVQPASLELASLDDRHGLLVTAVDESGGAPSAGFAAMPAALADVTDRATFESRQPSVATVSPNGQVAPVGDGQTQIAVSYGGQTAVVDVVVRGAAEARQPSFVNDVSPLLTRLGCNQGACHGKLAGQNGFRLSLRGYAPESDFEWITREYSGRRVSRLVAADSLLLRKPAGQAPHGGGQLMTTDSRAYRTLLEWVRAGMPGPVKPGPVNEEPRVERLEVLPGDRALRVGQQQPLLVLARYSDGPARDVTWLARYDSNDPGMLAVSADGGVHLLRHGETSVRVSFQGLVAVATFTAPYDRAIAPAALAERNNFIDDHVCAKLAALRIAPSAPASDAEFVRRVFLDAIGTLPTADEVRAFLADGGTGSGGAAKRARLIEQLLNRPEFVDFWTLQLADLLQNRKERDHDVRGTKGVRAFRQWLRGQVAANVPWNELARRVLTATGTSRDAPAVGYYVVTVGEQEADKSEAAASVAQAFLGLRVGCAKCHNHPLEKFTQDDYYHFAAFFSRVKLNRQEPRRGPTELLVSHRDPNQNSQPIGTHQPRTGEFLKPRPLDRAPMEIVPGEDPRLKLVEWMTAPTNEYFAGAIVNRVWRHYLGVGLVEPVDDLRATNPPSNPALWKALIDEFVSHGYDLRHLMRVILNSRAYQRGSATLPENESDARYYSHYLTRRLPAEVLCDALSQTTGIPDHFPGYPEGLRAIQLPDPGAESYFLTIFGRSERVTACACERNGEVTLPQLLHLQNSDALLGKITADEGRLAELLKRYADNGPVNNGPVIEELFLSTLSRIPVETERTAIEQALAGGDRTEVFRDLLWALLNSKEFAFNH
jgi:hypothetical protein